MFFYVIISKRQPTAPLLHRIGRPPTMKFPTALHPLFLALACLGSVEVVSGAAYLCPPDEPCQEEKAGSCADFFDAHYVWPNNGDTATYCCSFQEVGGNCTITTTSNCQYDTKAKYNCTMTDPETGEDIPCPLVGPTMFSAFNATTDECPPSEFDVPESSILGFMAGNSEPPGEDDEDPEDSPGEPESAASMVAFQGSFLIFPLVAIASLAHFP